MADNCKAPDENEVLRRMLNMPHKDHAFGETKKDGGKPKPAAKDRKDAKA